MRRHWAYLKYVLCHKWFVFHAGRKLGVPLIQLIIHDWDKFLPDEWFPYARAFYAPNGTSQYLQSDEFTTAWLKHQNRNPHHWQYWIITWDHGGTNCVPIPMKYVREMVADWIGAGQAVGKPDTHTWYKHNCDKIKLHWSTRIHVERLLDEAVPVLW